MLKVSHAQLTELGARWLQMNGFGVVSTDLGFVGAGDKPDVVGFRSSCSAIVIVKTSKTDFLNDARKPWRDESPSLGVYRFYLCPEGAIAPDEVPPRWGLIYEVNGRAKNIVVPSGNFWLGLGDKSMPYSDFLRFQHQSCEKQERLALYSIARRSHMRSPQVKSHISRNQSAPTAKAHK